MMIQDFFTYGRAYFLQKAGVPLADALEAMEKELSAKGPVEDNRHNAWVREDGQLVHARAADTESGAEDELALRGRRGPKYANDLQRQAMRAYEQASRAESSIRAALEEFRDLEDEEKQILEQTPLYHQQIKGVRHNMWKYWFLTVGEVALLSTLVADWMGIDPTRLGTEIVRRPLLVLGMVSVGWGLFVGFRKIGEHAIETVHLIKRVAWVSALAVCALGVGILRANQMQHLVHAPEATFTFIALFAAASFIVSLVAASYFLKGKQSKDFVEQTESRAKRLLDRKKGLEERMDSFEKTRKEGDGSLKRIIAEYERYFRAEEHRKKVISEKLEQHRRKLQAERPRFRVAYAFWQGWRERKRNAPAVSRLLPVAAAVVLLVLFFGGCGLGETTSKFNLFLLADRSSSGAEISCNPETIRRAAEYWLEAVDAADGGRFEVLIIGRRFDDTELFFSAERPERFPAPVSQAKRAWRDRFLAEVDSVGMRLPTDRGSAIAEAILRSSFRIPANETTILAVASDLRQVNASFNFERHVPNFESFSKWLRTNNIAPRFGNRVSIAVFGVHPGTPEHTSRMNPGNYFMLTELWRKVFNAWDIPAHLSEKPDFQQVSMLLAKERS